MRKTTLIFGLLCFTAKYLNACSETSMSGGSSESMSKEKSEEATTERQEDLLENDPVKDTDDEGTAKDRKKKGRQTFQAAAEKSPIDLVWVIDNSGSMGDKITQVRLNLTKFISTVNSEADMGVAILTQNCSEAEDGLSLCLDATVDGPRIKRINVPVASLNPLAILASALSSEVSVEDSRFGWDSNSAGRNPGSMTLDGKTYTPPAGGFIESSEHVRAASNMLNGFFREGASRVFVIVSDDEDKALGADQFSSIMSGLGPEAAAFKLFGFVGVGGGGDCASQTSAVYPALAARSGGEVYDICQTDWQPTFSKLTKAVISAGSGKFKLNRDKVTKLLSVVVDGETLAESQYELKGRVVALDDGLLKPESEVVVRFEYDPS